MNTTVKLADLQGVVDTLDTAEVEVRSYSGRAMYGRECPALVGDIEGFTEFVVAVARDAHDDWDCGLGGFSDVLHRVSVDSRGLSMVYYWPGVELVEDLK